MGLLETTQVQTLKKIEQHYQLAPPIPYITTRILIEQDNQYLYLHKTEARGGRLSLPGGKVKYKEFAREGLIREVFEETNLTVTKKDLQHIHTVHRRENGEFEVIFFFKVLVENTDDLALNEPHKFQGFVWRDKEEIPDNLKKEFRFALRKLKKERLFSEYPKKEKELLEDAAPQELEIIAEPIAI